VAGRQRIDRVRRQYNQWVANQTLEDYALRFTAKSARRWSAARVANTAIGAISFLVLEAIGGTITLNYGVTNAAAAILGVRDAINYEGQAAVELEQLADISETGAYPAAVEAGVPFTIRGSDLLHAVIEDRTDGVPAPVIAARFHHGVAALIEAGCLLMRERYDLGTVALSGGVFQNLLLLSATVARLEARGFRVLLHSRVPCNDGGISLGQAVIAGAQDTS